MRNIMSMQLIFKKVNKMLLFSYHNISSLPHNLVSNLGLGSDDILEKVLNVIKDNVLEQISMIREETK